jgi:hypothetical protein
MLTVCILTLMVGLSSCHLTFSEDGLLGLFSVEDRVKCSPTYTNGIYKVCAPRYVNSTEIPLHESGSYKVCESYERIGTVDGLFKCTQKCNPSHYFNETLYRCTLLESAVKDCPHQSFANSLGVKVCCLEGQIVRDGRCDFEGVSDECDGDQVLINGTCTCPEGERYSPSSGICQSESTVTVDAEDFQEKGDVEGDCGFLASIPFRVDAFYRLSSPGSYGVVMNMTFTNIPKVYFHFIQNPQGVKRGVVCESKGDERVVTYYVTRGKRSGGFIDIEVDEVKIPGYPHTFFYSLGVGFTSTFGDSKSSLLIFGDSCLFLSDFGNVTDGDKYGPRIHPDGLSPVEIYRSEEVSIYEHPSGYIELSSGDVRTKYSDGVLTLEGCVFLYSNTCTLPSETPSLSGVVRLTKIKVPLIEPGHPYVNIFKLGLLTYQVYLQHDLSPLCSSTAVVKTYPQEYQKRGDLFYPKCSLEHGGINYLGECKCLRDFPEGINGKSCVEKSVRVGQCNIKSYYRDGKCNTQFLYQFKSLTECSEGFFQSQGGGCECPSSLLSFKEDGSVECVKVKELPSSQKIITVSGVSFKVCKDSLKYLSSETGSCECKPPFLSALEGVCQCLTLDGAPIYVRSGDDCLLNLEGKEYLDGVISSIYPKISPGDVCRSRWEKVQGDECVQDEDAIKELIRVSCESQGGSIITGDSLYYCDFCPSKYTSFDVTGQIQELKCL